MRKERSDSIWVVYEGYSEGYMLKYFEENSKVKLNSRFCSGGTAESIVITAIKHSDRDGKIYAFFDEDFEQKAARITNETFKSLAKRWEVNVADLKKCPYKNLQNQNVNNRNPILVVSNPNSIDGLILRMLGMSHESLNKKTEQLKKDLDSFINRCELTEKDIEEVHRIDEKITKYKLQRDNSIENEIYFKSKIEDCDRKKSRMFFAAPNA